MNIIILVLFSVLEKCTYFKLETLIINFSYKLLYSMLVCIHYSLMVVNLYMMSYLNCIMLLNYEFIPIIIIINERTLRVHCT